MFKQDFDFPNQRVSDREKEKPEWYGNCCDWIIAQGLTYRNNNDVLKKYEFLNGSVDPEEYHKILNPYNFKKEEYKRFPADIRNYDLMKGIIRRYISEYIQNPHDFIVSANNPEVVLAKNAELKRQILELATQQLTQQIQQMFQQYVQEGGDPQQFNPQEQINVEEFIKNFNENYIDEISAQGAEILKVIQDITEDTLLYARLYFDFVSFGECYNYADVIGDKLIKRAISPIDAYPVPNDSMFVEDFDMFAERRKMTYQQIIDEFDEYLSETDRKYLVDFYSKSTELSSNFTFNYKDYFPETCAKFKPHELEHLNNSLLLERNNNGNLYDVWHVVWRGESQRVIVKYVNEAGIIAERIELSDYELNPEAGDIDIETIYVPQVYESVRIGTRNNGIYPYKARAIAYNREGKLPYNGIMELLPGFGQFSIVDIVKPFQIFYNIVAFQREMAVVKNKISILMIAKSLLGKVPEATIHKMLADGVLYVDDEDDQGGLRMQQVRFLNASYGDYIKQLTELMADTEQAAKNQVDMTPQRYGEIGNTAGKGVTEEAIMRGSMGSVIVESMMDFCRERDYARDMDYSKFAWIDGLNTSYRDENAIKYISLDVGKHMYADYVIKAKNSAKQKQKLDQLKQFAFSAAQNGDSRMAIAAITGDNIEAIKKLINKFEEEKQQHELQMKEMDQQLEQMKQEFELQKIQAKGEEDRKTAELEGLIDKEIELIRADANMNSYNNDISLDTKEQAVGRLNAERAEVDKQKLNFERQKMLFDFANKEADRRLKEKDIDTKLKIAKTNRNRYDK